MSVQHNYEVKVNWVDNRLGLMTSPDFESQVKVVTPPQFPKGMAGEWSPEHLFTAAVNSCLMTTFLAIAENSKLEFEHFSSTAIGKLELVDNKYTMSQVTLRPQLVIASEDDREKALKVLHKAEAACLISNSIKSAIVFEPQVSVAEASTV